MARRGRSGRSDSAIFTAEGAEKNPFFCFIAPRLCVSAVRLLSRGPAQNLFAFTQLCYFAPPQQARSSVVEHHLDMVVVGGSIPLAPTILVWNADKVEMEAIYPFFISCVHP